MFLKCNTSGFTKTKWIIEPNYSVYPNRKWLNTTFKDNCDFITSILNYHKTKNSAMFITNFSYILFLVPQSTLITEKCYLVECALRISISVSLRLWWAFKDSYEWIQYSWVSRKPEKGTSFFFGLRYINPFVIIL